MRNLLALLGLAVVLVIGVGWYQGWYHIARGPTTADGNQRIEIDINSKKITHDVSEGVRRGQEQVNEWLQPNPSTPPPAATTTQTPPPLTIPSGK